MYYSGMTIHALCPNCGKSIIDTGETRFISCPSCGRKIPSRVYDTETKAIEDINFLYNIDTQPPGRRTAGPGDKLSWLGPFRGIGGFLCWLAIVIFIILVVINFVTFFPALALTAPELLNEHHTEIRTELPLVIDNTPPIIQVQDNYSGKYYSGEVIEISAQLVEDYLHEAFVELKANDNGSGTNQERYPMIFITEPNIYTTTLQAPANSGDYQLVISATDYAGNYAQKEFSLEVLKNTEPGVIIKSPRYFLVMDSSTELEFDIIQGSDIVTQVEYYLDGQGSNLSLTGQYSLPTTNWVEGAHQLNFTIISDKGEMSYSNFTIIIDNTPPKVSQLTIQPLTVARNDTFGDRLTENIYYRGEFVKLKVELYEQHLASIKVLLEDSEYILEPESKTQAISTSNNAQYQTIFSMPAEPGEYKLQVIATDITGKSTFIVREFTIARVRFNYVSVPILNLITQDENYILSLPIINSTAQIKIPVKSGELEVVNITNTPGMVSIELAHEEFVNLSTAFEGENTLGVHAKRTYHYWDKLFLSIPFPPFLIVLPFVLTGWGLLYFYIFIAFAIILSNLYLFRLSITEALQQLGYAAKRFRAPMMESKNAFIMLAQLFLAIFSFNWIYYEILDLAAVPTRIPDFSALSNWAFIYNLTSAAVFEEIISRMLLIGVPLFIIHALIGRLKKPKIKYLLGGGFKVNKLTIILILFSSITFGLAHAPGWDYWKVIPTFISGFALGYLFIRHGLFLAILLHFTINYLTIPLRLINYSPPAVLIYFFIIYFFIGIGIIYIGYYLTRIINLFKKDKSYA